MVIYICNEKTDCPALLTHYLFNIICYSFWSMLNLATLFIYYYCYVMHVCAVHANIACEITLIANLWDVTDHFLSTARTVVDVATNTSKSFSCLFPSHKTTLVGPTQLGMTQQMPNMMTSVVTVNPDYTILKTQMPSPTGIMINKKCKTIGIMQF